MISKIFLILISITIILQETSSQNLTFRACVNEELLSCDYIMISEMTVDCQQYQFNSDYKTKINFLSSSISKIKQKIIDNSNLLSNSSLRYNVNLTL